MNSSRKFKEISLLLIFVKVWHESGSGPAILLSFSPFILPFFRLSILLSGIVLGNGSLVFSETEYDVRGPCGVLHNRARFFEKKMPRKWGKWAKNGLKIGLFEFVGKFSHYFFLKLANKESWYYLLYSCTISILWQNLIPETWTIQMAGFQNQLYL